MGQRVCVRAAPGSIVRAGCGAVSRDLLVLAHLRHRACQRDSRVPHHSAAASGFFTLEPPVSIHPVALHDLGHPQSLAFAGAPVPLVARYLETLAMVGEVRLLPDGRYAAVTEPL